MASFAKFSPFLEALAEKVHDFQNDTISFQLSDNAPNATMAVEADLSADLATGGGYTQTTGVPITKATYFTSSGLVSTTYRLKYLATYVFTATGASVGPFRYIILFNSTTASKNLIGWYDRGASITLLDGESMTFNFDTTNGIFSIA